MADVTTYDIGSALNALVLAAQRLGITDTGKYVILNGEENTEDPADKAWCLVKETETGGYEETPFRPDLGDTLELAYQTLTTIARTIDDVMAVQRRTAAVQIGNHNVQNNAFGE